MIWMYTCRLVALGAAAVLLGAVELVLLFVGFTMFMRTWSALQCIAHFGGIVFVSLFLDAHWSYASLAVIFALCSVIPCTLESGLAVVTVKFSYQRW